MEPRATQATPSPPPPPPPAPMPPSIKAIGWAGLLGGAWNLLVLPMMFLARAGAGPKTQVSYLDVLMTREVCLIGAIAAAVVMVTSIGLLRGREWGRKGAIVSLGLIAAAGLAWVVHVNIQLSGESDWMGLAIRIGIITIPSLLAAGLVGLCIRYLMSERVRDAFRDA